MSTAVLTFVYNESINLPIWIAYYGRNFGDSCLYVVDRGSDDGSTEHLGSVNVIKVPRTTFDEYQKTDFMTHLQNSLLNFYDSVVLTDCDELLVPDPTLFKDLRDYIEKSDFDYVNAIGINILHVMHLEGPLDLGSPILSQRQYGKFNSPSCKQLLSRIPLRWLPGFHATDQPPKFDKNLYNFHTKAMDYAIAVDRQRVNQNTIWSERSLAVKFGEHHRWDIQKFVHEHFLVPIHISNQGEFRDFSFNELVDKIELDATDGNGFFSIHMSLSKFVKIPEHWCNAV